MTYIRILMYFRKISAENVLKILVGPVFELLSEEEKNRASQIKLEFGEDCSIMVYLVESQAQLN